MYNDQKNCVLRLLRLSYEKSHGLLSFFEKYRLASKSSKAWFYLHFEEENITSHLLTIFILLLDLFHRINFASIILSIRTLLQSFFSSSRKQIMSYIVFHYQEVTIFIIDNLYMRYSKIFDIA